MNLLDLMVKIGVDDRASDQIGTITTSAIAKATMVGNAMYDAVKFGVGKVIEGTEAIVGGALRSYATYEQLEGGIAKLYGNAGMTLEQYADSVGKTTDEVRGEWERNDRAQEQMLQNARNAYKTAGQSANEYMMNATQFSSSLIKSLGGDTEEASRLTDVAMRAISDNVNTFGSNAGDVTHAIIGLSRQNYTMLDNLKLGYAGTQQGMLELINDSGVLGEKLTSTSQLAEVGFDKMIEAIQRVQEQQGIAGTTAREAMSTIEGSAAAAKASWENLLTGIGTGDQTMVQDAVSGLVTSIFGTWSDETQKREGGLINNLIPIVQNVGNALADEMPRVASVMAYSFMEALSNVIGVSDTDWLDELFYKIDDIKERVATAAGEFVEALTGSTDLSGFEAAFENLMTLAGQAFDFITEHADEIGTIIGTAITVIGQLAEAATNLFTMLSPYLPFIATLVATFGVLMPAISGVVGVIGAVSGAVTFLTTVVMPALGMIQSIPGLIAVVTSVLGGPITIIAAIAAAIVAFIATNEQARAAIVGAWNAVVNFFRGLPETLGKVWNSIKEDIGELVSNATKNWEGLKNAATEKWTAMQNAIREKMNGIRDKVAEGWQTLKDNVVGKLGELKTNVLNGWEGIKKDVTEKMQGLKDGVTERFEAVVSFVRDIPDKIRSALGDLGSLLWDAGSSIIDGLWDGMASVAESMLNWVSGIADTIASLKGPLPYDRKVLVDNGLALMSGLYKGIETGFERTVMPYVSTLAEQMQDSIEMQPLVAPEVNYEYSTAPAASKQQETTTVRDDAVVSLLTAILSTMPQGVYLDKMTLVGELTPDINVALGSL